MTREEAAVRLAEKFVKDLIETLLGPKVNEIEVEAEEICPRCQNTISKNTDEGDWCDSCTKSCP